MPLVTIHLGPDRDDAARDAIVKAVRGAIGRSTPMPAEDCYTIVTRHGEGDLIADPHWGGVNRESVLFIEILMVRYLFKDSQMKPMYDAIVEDVVATGVKRDDVFIGVHPNGLTDWGGTIE